MKVKLRREKVRQLRAGKGWTQEKLAEISRVHTRTIQRIENDDCASIQSLDALANALDVEPTVLLHQERLWPASDQRSPPKDCDQVCEETTPATVNMRQQVREIAKESERIETWLSYKWVGWPILFFGGFLTVEVLLMTQSNLDRTTIFNVFFPGITIGLLLMLVGKIFIHLSNRAYREKVTLKKFFRNEKVWDK